ncbi:MAG: hypothetical protein RLY31_2424 [Bacteroidota bacterium]|jgi:2-amino-4-hydroxy-6-hydroxymethyldihydropteridine diphosphokinase
MADRNDTAYLLLGANLGDRFATFEAARHLLATDIGHIRQVSALYETAPWGVSDQPAYLNQALELETALSAETLLVCLQAVEQKLGRQRKIRWESRKIDIDILFFGRSVIDRPELVIPHPRLHERRFALAPLLDIAADLVHPVFGRTVRSLWEELEDPLPVTRLPPPC